MQSLLKVCQHWATHCSHSIKSAHLLHKRKGEGDEPEYQLILKLPIHDCTCGGAEEAHVIFSMSILYGKEEISISFNNGMTISQMVHVLKTFQDTTNVLCTHMASFR